MSELKAGKLQAGISVTPANNFVLDPSADDGTLILRDSSGTALMTMVSGGEAETYARDNILGTVSQSGGVPTGAIIEKGSNANGRYTKFADGTMICIDQATSTTDVTTTRGAIFTTQDNIWTYPAEFLVKPSATATEGSNVGHCFGMMGSSSTSVSQYTWVLGRFDFVNDAPSANLIAIGRWF